MSKYIGDFEDNAIVPLGAFTTNAADGGRESFSASLEEADITIYSDDGDGTWTAMTLDASTIIITENPGSQVGVYLVAVDMSNDADFTTGKDYIAVLYPSDETIDSQAVSAVLGHWSCENRLLSKSRSELSAVPAANAGILDKLTWLFMLARNRVVMESDGTFTVYADDGTTPVATRGTSDDGTDFDAGEAV